MYARCDWRSLTHPAILRLDVGAASRLGGRLFRKEVARVGSWTHPATSKEVAFSRADLEEIATGTNAYIAAIGGKLRGPRLHDGVWITGEQPRADDNLAYWLSFAVEGDRLMGVVEAPDQKVADLLGGRIQGVSLCLVPLAKDSHGNEFKRVLDHVAFTPEPVIDGQENFVALARPGAKRVPIYSLSTKEPSRMSAMKTLAISLGFAAENMTDEEAAAEIEKKFKAHQFPKKDDKEAAASASALSASRSEAEAAKAEAVALSARVKALEADEVKRNAAEADAAIGEVKALAASAGKPEAFAVEREKRVRALWTKDRENALEMLALSREAIGAQPGGKTVVLAAPKAPEADATNRRNKFDTTIALSRRAGNRVEVSADGKKAKIHPNGAQAATGAIAVEIEA